MPRLTEAMKDVLGCEKSRGAAKKLWSANIRMGKPDRKVTRKGANPEKWNISVPGGKEIKRDSESSGERNWISPKVFINTSWITWEGKP